MDSTRQHRSLIYARRTGGGAESGTLDRLAWSNRTAQPWYQRGIILAWSKQCSLCLPACVCDTGRINGGNDLRSSRVTFGLPWKLVRFRANKNLFFRSEDVV